MVALNEDIFEIEERADGRLWVSTYSDKIYVLSFEGYFIRADLRLVNNNGD